MGGHLTQRGLCTPVDPRGLGLPARWAPRSYTGLWKRPVVTASERC